ncbi:MAG: hypothetical protein IMF19_00100 [Proteobacteria bacterium]|nr:hypothetical protein [Pseudomonadota bacterium]
MMRKVLTWVLLCATILILCTVIMPIGIANAEDAHFDTKEYPAHTEVFTSAGESTKIYVHDSFTTSGTPTPTPTPTTPPITTTPLLHPTNGPLKVEFEKITSEFLKIYIENPGPYFVYIPSSTKEGDTNFKISGITWGGKLEAYVESTHPHERWTIYAKDLYEDVKLPVMLVQIVLNPPKSAIEVAKMVGPMLLKSATGIDPIGETLDRFINYALEQKTESFILFTKCFLYCEHPKTENIEPKERNHFPGGISKSCFAIVTYGVILDPIRYNKAAHNDYKNKYDLPKKGAGYVLLPESRLVIELTYEEIREDKLGLMIKEYQALRGSRGTGRSDDLEYTLLHIYQGNYEGREHVHSMVRSGTTFDYYSFDSISSISITPSIPPEIDFNILLKPDKPTYRRGETAMVTIDVTNNRDQDTEIWLGTTFKYPTLKDPKDIQLKRAVIPKGKTKSFDDIEWTIPPDAPLGQYEIAVNCYKDAGQNEDYTDNIEWAPIFNVDMITPVLTPPSSEFDIDALLASISDLFEVIISTLNESVSTPQQKTIDVPPEQKARENVEDALGALAGMADAYSGFMGLITDLAEVEPPRDAEVKFEYHVLSARFCNNIAEAETYMNSGGIESADMSDALELVGELELAKTGFCIVIVDYSFIGFGEYESGKYPIVCNEKGDPFWESWQFYEMIKEEIERGYKEYE